jgi:hypothetical protein
VTAVASIVVTEESSRLQCPFCQGYDVDRLYLASVQLDSCACADCGARWDERVGTGEFVGRGSSATVLSPRLP